ncbi:MAG: phytanoyl-CoA dioxygenase family protein [candidate division Zixibacteria bacterium]|nr:phytanoyl-CoA dioxygenase family protein [candidate division Zixibacteria bacterium]
MSPLSPLPDRPLSFPAPVLSPEDRQFWEENGYVVVHDAVPPENLQPVIDDLWWFLGMNPDDPDDWYREPHKPGGMIEMYQAQSLWNNRQHAKVHQVFSEIWGTEKLWVSLDRVNMKPPVRTDKPDWDHSGMIHFDIDTTKAPTATLRVQGVLYLTDTAEDQGGFRCVPGFHRRYDEWVKIQPEDRNGWYPDLSGMEVKPIPGKAGDLIIWHTFLPHGNGRNTSGKPRLAQYISMSPAGYDNEEARQQRITFWKERLAPKGFAGDPRGVEKDNPPARLTDLGKKLLGLEPWA